MLGLHDFGSGGWRWLAIDVLWAIAGGLAIGGALGALVGKLVLYLRTRHQEAVGLDEFLALGLIAIAYGVAQLSFASGFLAVFAAGLALQRIKEPSKPDKPVERGEGQARAGRGKRKGARDARRSRRHVHDGSRARASMASSSGSPNWWW